MKVEDFSYYQAGFNLVMLKPITEAAREWVDEHLPEGRQTFGGAVAIEARYFGEIAVGIARDGLVVGPVQ